MSHAKDEIKNVSQIVIILVNYCIKGKILQLDSYELISLLKPLQSTMSDIEIPCINNIKHTNKSLWTNQNIQSFFCLPPSNEDQYFHQCDQFLCMNKIFIFSLLRLKTLLNSVESFFSFSYSISLVAHAAKWKALVCQRG